MFLALIAFVAGGSTTLSLAGYQVDPLSIAVLTGILSAYVGFVVFAWFRLCGAALMLGLRGKRS